MERRDALVALRKVRMWASLVFRYAIATGRAENDPAGPLPSPFDSGPVPYLQSTAAIP
jgi:hypothetical protein